MNNKYQQDSTSLENMLKECEGKTVLIKLKNTSKIEGTIKYYDQHMNLYLVDVTVTEEKEMKFSSIILRGSNISAISIQTAVE